MPPSPRNTPLRRGWPNAGRARKPWIGVRREPDGPRTGGRLRDGLRSGDWLTGERIRLVAIAVLFASAAGFLYLVATAHGSVDLQGRPLGTDFSNVYAAGTYVNEGNAAAAFDPVQQFAREQSIFGDDTQFYGWHYPPFFLFVAAPLALMPYGLGARGLAGGHARPLSVGNPRDPRPPAEK